jgi:hypothetical protein
MKFAVAPLFMQASTIKPMHCAREPTGGASARRVGEQKKTPAETGVFRKFARRTTVEIVDLRSWNGDNGPSIDPRPSLGSRRPLLAADVAQIASNLSHPKERLFRWTA